MAQCYYLFVCCLFILHINVNIAEKVASSDYINRFLSLQTKLRKLDDEISSKLKALQTANGNKDLTVFEPSDIELDFRYLKKELEIQDNRRETSNPDYNKEPSHLSNIIIADIKKQDYASAEEELAKLINNLETVSNVIRTVYENDSNNFELLAKFIESLSDIKLIYACVEALLKVMVENDHANVFKFIRLAKVLETVFIQYSDVDYFTKKIGQFTYNALVEQIKDCTLKALNVAVIKGEFDGDGEMDRMTAAVYLFKRDEWENIIYDFVNSNIDKFSNVLDIINSHRFIQQRVSGVNILYWSIQFHYNPKSNLIIEIASILKELRLDSEFEKLDTSLKELVDRIIENLPTCARNMFFLSSACLWNQGTGLYLTALNSTMKNDSKRREIVSTDPSAASHWYFSKIDNSNYFVISSRSYKNEVLFAANSKYSHSLRNVFNRKAKKNDNRTKWLIELDNDICYVKSAKYNEYLITWDYYDGDNMRYVFTWVPDTSIAEPKLHWQIIDCNENNF